MPTQCTPPTLPLEPLAQRAVVASFDGGHRTSDAGGLLLREVEAKFGFLEQFARCFTDHRDPHRLEHPVGGLLKQRVFGLCLGYEDLNDHDDLRHDPLLAVLVGKPDPQGHDRARDRDRGKPLAGKSTLNRLELTPLGADPDRRYQKIVGRTQAMHAFFVDAFVQQQTSAPEQLILDLDATDFPLHGHQLGRFFPGYYGHYCYLPLYIFCGDHPLLALLRPADLDASTGALKHLARIVARLRQTWPRVKILVRGDSGFCREHLMAWCEANGAGLPVRPGQEQPPGGDPGAGVASSPGTVRADGASGPRLARLPLRDAEDLEPTAAGGGQGGASGRGAQPALRGDLAVGRRGGGTGAVRAALLRSWGDGEPHQGAAVGVVRRPGELPHALGEPDPAVPGDAGVRGTAGSAAVRPAGDGVGAGAGGDHPDEALEDRGAGAGECAAGVRWRPDRSAPPVPALAGCPGLEPNRAAYLDTLVEFHFQRCGRDEAVQLARRLLQLAPERASFRAQFERFEAGDPSSEVPAER